MHVLDPFVGSRHPTLLLPLWLFLPFRYFLESILGSRTRFFSARFMSRTKSGAEGIRVPSDNLAKETALRSRPISGPIEATDSEVSVWRETIHRPAFWITEAFLRFHAISRETRTLTDPNLGRTVRPSWSRLVFVRSRDSQTARSRVLRVCWLAGQIVGEKPVSSLHRHRVKFGEIPAGQAQDCVIVPPPQKIKGLVPRKPAPPRKSERVILLNGRRNLAAWRVFMLFILP